MNSPFGRPRFAGLVGLVMAAMAFASAGCSHTQGAPCAAAGVGEANPVVHVVRHRWHTGVVIAAEDLRPSLAFVEDRFTDAAYYEFGWGDGRFYREPNASGLMLRALFWPTDTVLHVVALGGHPAGRPHSGLQSVAVSERELGRLQRALAGSFQRNEQRAPIPVSPGLYGQSRFFKARGTFWFANTCNTWTARMLAQAGLDVRSFMVLTADGVMEQVAALSDCSEGEAAR